MADIDEVTRDGWAGERAVGSGRARTALRAAAVAALLLAGCAPYMRTDMPSPRSAGVRDALASIALRCGERAKGASGDERRCVTRDDGADGAPSSTPPGPTQRKP